MNSAYNIVENGKSTCDLIYYHCTKIMYESLMLVNELMYNYIWQRLLFSTDKLMWTEQNLNTRNVYFLQAVLWRDTIKLKERRNK